LVRGVGIRPPAAEADSCATLRNDKQKNRQGQVPIRRFWLRRMTAWWGYGWEDGVIAVREVVHCIARLLRSIEDCSLRIEREHGDDDEEG
jgi:hypothetical protein